LEMATSKMGRRNKTWWPMDHWIHCSLLHFASTDSPQRWQAHTKMTARICMIKKIITCMHCSIMLLQLLSGWPQLTFKLCKGWGCCIPIQGKQQAATGVLLSHISSCESCCCCWCTYLSAFHSPT
jgi:hypothetical protein